MLIYSALPIKKLNLLKVDILCTPQFLIVFMLASLADIKIFLKVSLVTKLSKALAGIKFAPFLSIEKLLLTANLTTKIFRLKWAH